MRRSFFVLVAPWVPPPRHDVKVTMPPPPGGEVGGSFGVSTGYSDRLARTPYWKRMALSTYELRMRENETRYPMSAYRPGEYDIRYTVSPYPDHLKHRPLLEVGEAHQIPTLSIPVIFLANVWDEEKQVWFGRQYETVYVNRAFARDELIPQRYAIYATEEAYTLLGLPVVNHGIHAEIPKTPHDYKKLLEKQSYMEERWKYSIEYLFRKYEAGPPELLDKSEEGWDGVEEIAVSSAAGGAGDGSSKRKGPIKQRKARKIKLF
ncbi:Ribosomal protein L9 N-terminal domain containing protein [Lotmaria passim]